MRHGQIVTAIGSTGRGIDAVNLDARFNVTGGLLDNLVTDMYAREYRSLVGLAVLLVGDAQVAEDIVQNAFIAIHGGWRWARDAGKARACLRRAVVCKSRSVLRRRATGPARTEHVIVAALSELTEREREALVLRYYAGLSEAETAAAMGISRSASTRHVVRGLTSLQLILEQTGQLPRN